MSLKKFTYSGGGIRFDLFLKGENPSLSREFIKRLISDGLAKLNGKSVKPAAPLKTGDEITLKMPGGEDHKPVPRLAGMLLKEDEGILAIDKPIGLCVHPTDSNWEKDPRAAMIGSETVVSILAGERPDLASLPRFGLVHRLDRETSGLMLIAKTAKALASLSDAFRERLVKKIYIGAVRGNPESDAWTVDAPIGRPTGSRKIKVWEYGRESLTDFTVLERAEKACLLEIRPKTGRTNQIRVHLSHAGHPILGDKIYGEPDAPRMMLHAMRLEFPNPSTGKKMKLECPPPADFRLAWEKISGRPFKLKNI